MGWRQGYAAGRRHSTKAILARLASLYQRTCKAHLQEACAAVQHHGWLVQRRHAAGLSAPAFQTRLPPPVAARRGGSFAGCGRLITSNQSG